MKSASLAIVQDTVSAVLQQGGLDERFRADFTKLVAAVFDAGCATTAVVHESSPLSADELATVRAALSALAAK